MMNEKTNRARLISLIHAQKNAAELPDDVYRLVITSAVGKESCKYCSMKELRTVFYVLNGILAKQGKKQFRFYSRWEKNSLSDAVIARAKKILGEGWEVRLDSFTNAKFKKKPFSRCNNSELRIVMAFLTNMERKERIAK